MRALEKKNIEYPWIKIAIPVLTLFFVFIGVSGVFRRYTGEENLMIIPKVPMMRQPEVPNKVFRVNLEGKKLVALTFDDGPAEGITPRLLDILMSKNAVATFFELGGRMRNNPEITKRAFREGHEVGSHTMWHQNLIQIPRGEAESDINEAKGVFREVIGEEVKLTRAPYGNANDFVREVINTPIIYWSVDTRDWDVKNADLVVENTLNATFDGAIVLMHDVYDSTVDAVPRVIDELRGQGYEFVTVSELAEKRGVKLEPKETYFRFEP